MSASTVNIASVQEWEAINWDALDLEKVVVTSSIIGTLDGAARRESGSNAKVIIKASVDTLTNMDHANIFSESKATPIEFFSVENCRYLGAEGRVRVHKITDSMVSLFDGVEVGEISNSCIIEMVDSCALILCGTEVLKVNGGEICLTDEHSTIVEVVGASSINELRCHVDFMSGNSRVTRMVGEGAVLRSVKGDVTIKEVSGGAKVEVAKDRADITYTPTGKPADMLASSVIVRVKGHDANPGRFTKHGGTLAPELERTSIEMDLMLAGFKKEEDGRWVGYFPLHNVKSEEDADNFISTNSSIMEGVPLYTQRPFRKSMYHHPAESHLTCLFSGEDVVRVDEFYVRVKKFSAQQLTLLDKTIDLQNYSYVQCENKEGEWPDLYILKKDG
jgi:hypothetical protein